MADAKIRVLIIDNVTARYTYQQYVELTSPDYEVHEAEDSKPLCVDAGLGRPGAGYTEALCRRARPTRQPCIRPFNKRSEDSLEHTRWCERGRTQWSAHRE